MIRITQSYAKIEPIFWSSIFFYFWTKLQTKNDVYAIVLLFFLSGLEVKSEILGTECLRQ